MRRYGRQNLNIKYTPRPGAYAVIVKDGKLLITHQAQPDPDYQLPGGGIDAGESPIHALHREVLEETGWRIEVMRKIRIYQRFTYMPEYDLQAQKICHIYLARGVRNLGVEVEAGHSNFWMTPEQAANLLTSDGDADTVMQLLL